MNQSVAGHDALCLEICITAACRLNGFHGLIQKLHLIAPYYGQAMLLPIPYEADNDDGRIFDYFPNASGLLSSVSATSYGD